MTAVLARISSLIRSPVAWTRAGRVALLVLFVWLAGRFWHPYYGFTQFLQIDTEMAARMVPALRDGPVFIHGHPGSYDGGYYAQVATNPALDPALLKPALDDAGYRARRILLGAVAWGCGGGDPVGVVHAYALLNVGLWFGLAAALWRVFPSGPARGIFAWAALLFGSGVLFSVRFALTDLAALLLSAMAGLAVERHRPGVAAGLLGLAGLTRETAVLGLVLLWDDVRAPFRRPVHALLWLAAGLLPLALWLAYVHHALGGSSAGQRNLTWPLAGWGARWLEFRGGAEATGNPLLVFESVLEHVALTVQAAYLAFRPRPACPWWRLGAASLALMIVLGHAVWGGFPNAASRVLLPLTLAFNVRAVRDGAKWGWLLAGNLSVLAGVHALAQPPGSPHHLPMPSAWESRHLLETDAGWKVAEWGGGRRWAWCHGEGGLDIRVWPHRATVKAELEVRGITPRALEIRHEGRLVWSGRIGEQRQWIPLPELPLERGRLRLELRSPEPGWEQDPAPPGQRINFACFGARLAE